MTNIKNEQVCLFHGFLERSKTTWSENIFVIK